MSLRISGKHMDIGDSFRARIDARVNEAVLKYFDGGFSGHATVSKSGSRFAADCLVHLDTGMSLQGTGEAQEPIVAFEMAADRLEKRLRRYKRRLKGRASGADAEPMDVAYTVVAAIADDDEEVPEDYAPTIVAESTVALRTMSVASAVIEMDARDSAVIVFRNAGTDNVNVVYRRPDGNIGWIDPSTARSAG
ncbi:MAG: ribosome-associated translation inhibitor RaiA [Rhizobiaceae bacterium]|nr:ribosome-associated translation inhibitor RaiA [Rhizobiaceae bacterium]